MSYSPFNPANINLCGSCDTSLRLTATMTPPTCGQLCRPSWVPNCVNISVTTAPEARSEPHCYKLFLKMGFPFKAYQWDAAKMLPADPNQSAHPSGPCWYYPTFHTSLPPLKAVALFQPSGVRSSDCANSFFFFFSLMGNKFGFVNASHRLREQGSAPR